MCGPQIVLIAGRLNLLQLPIYTVVPKHYFPSFQQSRVMSIRPEHQNSISCSMDNDQSDSDVQSESVKYSATSRLSISQFKSVVSEFSEFKQWLIEDIGFVRLLKIPLLNKLNLKFSTWLMSKVSVFNRAIIISDSKILKFTSQDVHKVLGIPDGPGLINGAHTSSISQRTVGQLSAAIGLTDKDVHSMRVVEKFLRKDITEVSTAFQKHCFQSAFIIFAMGHILAPTSKHDYVSVDYWEALISAESIPNYNWCEYVLKYLLEGVEKFKDDLKNNTPVTHLIGCHLFFQIFYLDNLDLGPLNRPHSVMPRIADFDAETIRKMINMCATKGDLSFDRATLRSARSICYTRYVHDCPADSNEERRYRRRGIWHPKRSHGQDSPNVPPINARIDSATSPTSCLPGPSDFSTYMRTKHPLLVNDPISWILKEHNAIGFRNQTSLRNMQHQEDKRFAEKLLSLLAERCICCSIRGHDSCALRTFEQQNAGSFCTPVQRKRPLLSGDASSSSTNHTPWNLPCTTKTQYVDDCAQTSSYKLVRAMNKTLGMTGTLEDLSMPSFDLGFDDPASQAPRGPSKASVIGDSPEALLALNKCWAENIVGNIMLIHEDQQKSSSLVLFGQQTHSTPAKKSFLSPFFARAPDSFTTSAPFTPNTSTVIALQEWIRSAPNHLLERNWIVHHFPRFLRISGSALRNQLLRNHPIDHETCAAIMRLFNQLDMHSSSAAPCLRWRHFFETDFATHVIAGTPIDSLTSIQNQICNLQYNLGACKLLIIPAILQHGWVCFMWDMQYKCIHVIDPLYISSCSPCSIKYLLDSTADTIHSTFFQCLHEFYDDFPFANETWDKHYPALTEDHLSSHESGAAMLHCARFYNGRNLQNPLSKDTLFINKTSLLCELLQLMDNVAEIPDGALQSLKNI